MSSTPLTTEDRIALHELIAKYSHLLDLGGIDRMGEIFTEDCRFTVAAYDVDIHGLQALIDFFHPTMAAQPNIRHVITNVYAESTGINTADMHAYLNIVDSSTKAITTTAVYLDHCVKTPAGWRIAVRNISAS